jgi:hypothetical protein
LGFSEGANLDEGGMWPVAFALMELTADVEARIATLVKASGELMECPEQESNLPPTP